MDAKFKKLSQTLVELDKKAEGLDEVLRDVRIEILNAFWDLKELKINKDDPITPREA